MKTPLTESKADRMTFDYTLDANQIPTGVVVSADKGTIYYQCPDSCWKAHLKAWADTYRDNPLAPQPMPTGHCMFENPIGYGCVILGDENPEHKRQAIERSVRSDLMGGGWLRDVEPDKAEAIIQATVKAKLGGQDTGAAPYLACVCAW
jgi:hypothetical protein